MSMIMEQHKLVQGVFFFFTLLFFSLDSHTLEAKEEYVVHNSLYLGLNEIYDAIFSNDGQSIVTLAQNHSINLWEVEGGRRYQSITTKEHQATTLITHPSQPIIVTGGKDKTLQSWDISRGRSLSNLRGHIAEIQALTFNQQGNLLASGAKDGTVFIWDYPQRIIQQKLNQIHLGGVTALVFHPAKELLATAGKDGIIKIWEIDKDTPIHQIKAHDDAISSLVFHPEGTSLVSASQNTQIFIWNWEEEKVIQQLIGHSEPVNSVDYHQNGKILVSGGADKTIRVWNTSTGKEIEQLKFVDEIVKHVQFDNSGKQILGTFSRKSVRSWRLGQSAYLGTLKGHTNSISSLVFSPNGKYLLSSSLDKTLKIWDTTSKKEVRSYDAENHRIQQIEIFKDGEQFTTAGADSLVKLWNTQTGTVSASKKGHRGKVNSIALHPNQINFISGGSDKTWVLWEKDGLRIQKEKEAHDNQITTVAVSPKGDFFATGSADRTIKVWRFEEQKLEYELQGHQKPITKVLFSPSQDWLASSSQDYTIRIWDLSETGKGKQKYLLQGHEFIVNQILFSKNGDTLISTSKDKTVRLWDLSKGMQIRILSGEDAPITTATLSPNGELIAVANLNHEITLLTYPLALLEVGETKEVTNRFQPLAPIPENIESVPLPFFEENIVDLSDLTDTVAVRPVSFIDSIELTDIVDPTQETEALQRTLNHLLKTQNICDNVEKLESVAFEILSRFPQDQAAYHALLKTAILHEDLNLIFVLAHVGLQAKFLSHRYNYEEPLHIQNTFSYWIDQVFDQSHFRMDSNLELAVIDCDGREKLINFPKTLRDFGIPIEYLQQMVTTPRYVDLRDFKGLSSTEFFNRFFADIRRTVVHKGKPLAINRRALSKQFQTPSISTGIFHLNLERFRAWGDSHRILFQIREGGDPWHSYQTSLDRIINLRLPSGFYYLRIGKNIRRAFILKENETKKLKITNFRR